MFISISELPASVQVCTPKEFYQSHNGVRMIPFIQSIFVIIDHHGIDECLLQNNQVIEKIGFSIELFKSQHIKIWDECNRTKVRFEEKSKDLMDSNVLSDHLIQEMMALKIRPRSEPPTSCGRPPKDFQDLSLRSKRHNFGNQGEAYTK